MELNQKSKTGGEDESMLMLLEVLFLLKTYVLSKCSCQRALHGKHIIQVKGLVLCSHHPPIM